MRTDSVRAVSLPRRLGLVLLGLMLVGPLLNGCDGQAPAVDAQVVPRPPPGEVLAAGRHLAFNGQWEEAAEVFASLLTQTDETGLAARYELALAYSRMGRPAEAVVVLDALLALPPTTELAVRAWFLYGVAQSALGDRAAAARAFARYTEIGGPAAAYARVEQARALNELDLEAALAVLQPLVEGAGPAHARRQALRLAGQLEERAGRLDQALARYTALLDIAVWQSDRVFALNRIGDVQARQGNVAAATEALRSLVTRYPATAEAEAALERLAALGSPADTLTAALVHYRRRNDQRARDLFNAYLRAHGSKGPGAATALFYLGALAERRDDTRLALENYQEAYEADPLGPLAVEALWERAGVFDELGWTNEAQAAYTLVAERFPTSARAADAAFRAAYIAYTAGRLQQARQMWSAGMSTPQFGGITHAARAAFWAGRAASDMGDAVGARLAYTEAARRDPTGYYGLRAAAMLAGEPQAPRAHAGTMTLPAPDWAGVEAWLAAWAGPEDRSVWQTATMEDWQAGIDLLQLGRGQFGIDAVELAINARSREPWVLYRMARVLADLGQPHLVELAGAHLLNAAPPTALPAPSAVMRLVYPAPWPDLVQRFAQEHGTDPLLVYAMMRQESAFNPTAGSSAGAFGLTQVIPSTAREIARALGRTDFQFGDLARPAVAIQFGTYYLGTQLKNFNGNVYHALAAYNGGPGNAARWARPAGPQDVDRFYEGVDYTETKLYLRLVLQNYAWYRFLYGGAPRPSLTSDLAVTIGVP